MKRTSSLFVTLALGALSAGCTWLVGVSGDVQLAAPTDASAAHDGADADEAATDAAPADAIEESADAWTRDEDGAPPPDGNADARDDARG